MLKNYITIAINNLLKNKLYSAINIVGLAIGLAACIIIALYVREQSSYDKQWKDSDRIYRVNYSAQWPGKELHRWSTAPVPAMPALQKYFGDKIEQGARIYGATFGPQPVDTGNAKFRDRIVFVDPSFIEMFQFEVLAGSLEDTLTDRNNVALNEKTARRYFGNQDPIGKVITVGAGNFKTNKKVTAVYRIPGKTVLDYIALFGLLDATATGAPSPSQWWEPLAGTYFKLKKGAHIETLKPHIPALIDRHTSMSDPTRKASDVISLFFQKLEMAYLDSTWDSQTAGGDITLVMAFTGISLLILLIGCINFTILTTAKATQRAREVAMRKVAGATRKQLMIQFIGESTFIVFLAMILSIGVVEIMLPLFESIVGKSFSLNYTSPSTFLPLLALLLIVGISGGLYPAVVLSGFRPGDSLKANQSKETRGSISFRQVLVIFQFSVSIFLIIFTGVIFAQTEYSINRDPGYNKDNLLVINGSGSDQIQAKIGVLKQELLNLADISNVGVSAFQPSNQRDGRNDIFSLPGHSERTFGAPVMNICDDYFKTYQIPIIAGRGFSSMDRDIPEPTAIEGNESKRLLKVNVVINESAVRKFGFTGAEDAVGKILTVKFNNNNFLLNFTIIGVVSDNHLYSINAPPRAEVYSLNPRGANIITARFKGSPQKIVSQVNSVWKNVMGDEEKETVFVDQLVAKEFEQERTAERILVSFSILAILIACMGLFGSASFTVDRRTKEIGLRKVMGARVKNIVSLLLWQFSKPVLIATIIAWPVAIFAMQSWLERFQYQINPLLMIPICLVSGLITLAIAWFTVAGNTIRVARSKPITALRYE